MLKFKSGRTFGLLILATFLSAAVPSVPRSPGYTFDMESTTTASGMMAAGNMKMVARAMVSSKGLMRMDIVSFEGPPGSYAVGDYYLTSPGKMTIVHPANKTYVDMTEMVTGAMNSLPPELAAQMKITDITGNTEKLTDGPQIDGRATDHYRTTVGYSMSLMGQSIPTTIVSDQYLAKLSISFDNPLLGDPKSPITTGPMVELIKKQIELAPKVTGAIAIKQTSKTSVSMMGNSIETTTTTEMKNIKEGDVDESRFVIPEGYTKVSKP